MPGIYTHNQIAESTFIKLGRPKYLSRQMNEYMLGSIGLDFFLYQNVLSPYKKNTIQQLADICMYHHHNDFLVYLLAATAKEVDLMMYYLGFITNYCSNRTIRPFSYYSAEKPEGGYELNDVNRFDQAIDTYYYKKINLAGSPVQNTVFKSNKRATFTKVSQMLSIAINKTHGSRVIRPGAIERAFDDANAFTSKLASSNQKAPALLLGKNEAAQMLTPPKFIAGNDVMNLSHRQWHYLWDASTARKQSITDLIDISVDESVKLIETINSYYLDEITLDDVGRAIGDIDFDGRLS